ncbi:MAG: HaeII family restriction endonuclease [Candidatus Zixiibacteriota bacterium]
MPTDKAKKALDTIIRKSRVHLYKPIQIAEILFQHRSKDGWDLEDLESYRNVSKKWRDAVSLRLVGRKSTSSQKYQDNVFEANAMPPKLLARLGQLNKAGKGFVEAYVYKCLEHRLGSVYDIQKHIHDSSPSEFSLEKVVLLFQNSPGLRRSVDKMYEIFVYALFTSIVRALKAQITVEVLNEDKEILRDFGPFLSMVLGIDDENPKAVVPAALYRVGVTNAADRGLDMWSNFGVAFQVKHLSLTPKVVEDIAGDIVADRIVIVCLDSEKKAIESLLAQVGWGERIKGIITLSDLDDWYNLCLSGKYRDKLGKTLLRDVENEFVAEFPSSTELKPFMLSRGYDKITLPKDWEIN